MSDEEFLLAERQRERAWSLKPLTLHMAREHGWGVRQTKQVLASALSLGMLPTMGDLGPMTRHPFDEQAARAGAASALDSDDIEILA